MRSAHKNKRQARYTPGGGPWVVDRPAVAVSGSLAWLLQAWLDALASLNYSPRTVHGRLAMGLQFCDWCDERAIVQAAQVTRPLIERYRLHLSQIRGKNNLPLSVNYQIQRLSAVQYLFSWAVRQNLIGANPAADVDRPRPVRALPDHLSRDEVAAVLAQPDTETALGLRDRAILELLYSTGIRRSEAVKLTLHDRDAQRRVLRIVQGKGMKDRYVPIGKRALLWLSRYEERSRAQLATPGTLALFVTADGGPFQPDPFGNLVRKLLQAAGVHKSGACHLFRHTMATDLLEGGCDVRLVQEMLGHAKLDTTAIYTHVGIEHLKAAHAAHHPAENAD